jgi:hypothetical protein
MKKLLIFLLLLPVLAFSQRADVLVKTDIFTVHYSEVFQQPLNIEYTVLCPNGTASRKGMDFYTNDSIITSDNADYENNIYDKGHLAPAAAFTCNTQMLHKTFSYLKLCTTGSISKQRNLETSRSIRKTACCNFYS